MNMKIITIITLLIMLTSCCKSNINELEVTDSTVVTQVTSIFQEKQTDSSFDTTKANNDDQNCIIDDSVTNQDTAYDDTEDNLLPITYYINYNGMIYPVPNIKLQYGWIFDDDASLEIGLEDDIERLLDGAVYIGELCTCNGAENLCYYHRTGQAGSSPIYEKEGYLIRIASVPEKVTKNKYIIGEIWKQNPDFLDLNFTIEWNVVMPILE